MIKTSTILKLIIPSLMIFFFARNIVLVETENMDSWMGGGMRMFAKIDKMIYRVAGFEVNYNDKTYFINLRNVPKLKDEDIALRILPSEERTDEILKKIKQFTWCYDSGTDTIILNEKDHVCNNTISGDKISKVKVYAINFDNKTNVVNLKPLN